MNNYNDVTFVIAHYNEDISWLNPIKKRCTIINKYNDKDIPNVGRESDTYLYYIIKNYYNLSDYIVFSQARISDHIKNGDHELLIKLYNEAKQYGKSIPYSHHYWKNYYANHIWGPKWNTSKIHFNKLPNKSSLDFYQWFVKFINPIYPNPINIYRCGLFSVKKELILKHNIEYYINLKKQIDYSSNPLEGHYFERSWYYIFD
jgi:hypothetical protein